MCPRHEHVSADDTKVFRTVKTDTDKETLQDDLTKLVKWSEKWHLCECGPLGSYS